MFDIGFPELVLIAIVGLLVIGPERLPETLRTLGLWFGRMRRSFTSVKAEIEKEIGMDEVRRQLHNETIMDEMKRIEQEVKTTADSARASLNEGVKAAEATPDVPSIYPGTGADISAAVAAQDEVSAASDAVAHDERSHADAAEAGQAPADSADDERPHADAADDEPRTHADAVQDPAQDSSQDDAPTAEKSDDTLPERVKSG